MDFRHKLRRHVHFGKLLANRLDVFRRGRLELHHAGDTAGNLPIFLDRALNIAHTDQDHRVFGSVGNVPDFFKGRRLIRQCKLGLVNNDGQLVRRNRLQKPGEKLL